MAELASREPEVSAYEFFKSKGATVKDYMEHGRYGMPVPVAEPVLAPESDTILNPVVSLKPADVHFDQPLPAELQPQEALPVEPEIVAAVSLPVPQAKETLLPPVRAGRISGPVEDSEEKEPPFWQVLPKIPVVLAKRIQQRRADKITDIASAALTNNEEEDRLYSLLGPVGAERVLELVETASWIGADNKAGKLDQEQLLTRLRGLEEKVQTAQEEMGWLRLRNIAMTGLATIVFAEGVTYVGYMAREEARGLAASLSEATNATWWNQFMYYGQGALKIALGLLASVGFVGYSFFRMSQRTGNVYRQVRRDLNATFDQANRR